MDFNNQFEHDKNLWNSCAQKYETSIVLGHPDVTAYEQFEETFLDRLLLFLIRDLGQKVCLYDVGCGSGRLHLRYGPQMIHQKRKGRYPASKSLSDPFDNPCPDPTVSAGLIKIGGVDFSHKMVELAKNKVINAGLSSLLDNQLEIEQGSAFDLSPFPSKPLPVVVTLCNSIGVMQGPHGAQKLFQSMRRAVEQAGGIALISAYQKKAVPSFALGNYESTMDVSGQPTWITPFDWASADFIKKPRQYKRAFDADGSIRVDVYDSSGRLVKKDVILKRDSESVNAVIETGHIETFNQYESWWYSWEQFHAWIGQWWPERTFWHIEGHRLDALRASPVQLAILDVENRLSPYFQRLGISKSENIF